MGPVAKAALKQAKKDKDGSKAARKYSAVSLGQSVRGGQVGAYTAVDSTTSSYFDRVLPLNVDHSSYADCFVFQPEHYNLDDGDDDVAEDAEEAEYPAEQDQYEEDESEEPPEYLNFTSEEYLGMGIIDSGATRCAGGLHQVEYLHEKHSAGGGKPFELDDSGMKFRFAGGEKSQAGAMVTLWPEVLEGDPLSIHALPNEGPILLGMDFLNHIGATHDIPKGLLLLSDGRCIPLRRLRSGHQALDLTTPWVEHRHS